MKLILGLFGVLLLIVIIGTYSRNLLFPNSGLVGFKSTPSVTINNHTFNVEVSKTEEAKRKGLSARTSLQEDSGMMFIFDKPQVVIFWMKDMKFPLDIIYIQGSKIVEVNKNLQPPTPGTIDSEIETYPSSHPVDKVLEINGGLSDKYGFKVGDTVDSNNL